MYKEREIKYKKDKGLVSVEVKNAGFVNQGSFSLNVTNGFEIMKVGDGKFGDMVPDVFVIPVQPFDLENWTLMIIGSYAAAFGHTQIHVDYNFYQQGKLTDDPEEIRENTSPLVAHHDITFKAN